MSARDLSLLVSLLNTPGVLNVPVRNVTVGELRVSAVGPGGITFSVSLKPRATVNIIEFAPASWWLSSRTLLDAVYEDWIDVIAPNAKTVTTSTTIVPEEPEHILQPKTATVGDLLVWNGSNWVVNSAGTAGYLLTSNGPSTIPTWQAGAGGGGGGNPHLVTGQSTAALSDGDFGYLSGNNTWALARSNGTRAQATVVGANTGTAGSMNIFGQIASAKFTTAGGSPAAGARVYLASGTDDGGTGSGKLTAAPPSTGYHTVVGTCLDNTNYAGLKTCVVLMAPETPVEL